ncbi:MAG: hypothetical protein LBG19_11410 [Prevotellaceae bacterium]|jgi:hypothetical protein|nr:hypothetical protein [Prevotellaceae bacterium]
MNIDFLTSLIKKIENASSLDSLEWIDSLRTSYTNVAIYDTIEDCLFSTIIISNHANTNSQIISFFGEKFTISLSELEYLFGKFDIGYNFRDNYTAFFFKGVGKKILKIYCEIDNNFKKEGDRIYEYSLQGKTRYYTPEEVIFNNIFFEIRFNGIGRRNITS